LPFCVNRKEIIAINKKSSYAKNSNTALRGGKMEENKTQGMPIYMQMALAHNVNAMQCFLRLDDQRQDELIERARKTDSKREIQKMIDGLPYKSSST
jgi:hypothetical protein